MQRLYTENNFKEQDLSIVICSICSDVIFEPRTSKNCSHTYCKECIELVLKDTYKCPQCTLEFEIQNCKLFEVLYINGMVYTCDKGDCNATFIMGTNCTNLLNHKKLCLEELIPCNRCKTTVARKDIENHMNNSICTNSYISVLEKEIKFLKKKYNHSDDNNKIYYKCVHPTGVVISDIPSLYDPKRKSLGTMEINDILPANGDRGDFIEINYNGIRGYVIKKWKDQQVIIKV